MTNGTERKLTSKDWGTLASVLLSLVSKGLYKLWDRPIILKISILVSIASAIAIFFWIHNRLSEKGTPKIRRVVFETLVFIFLLAILVILLRPLVIDANLSWPWQAGGPQTFQDKVQCAGENIKYEGDHVTVQEDGDCHISIESGEMLLGSAEQFHDDVNQPLDQTPCTAFVITGPIEMDLSLYWGGMDYRSTPTDESKIDDYLSQKVVECMNYHPTKDVKVVSISQYGIFENNPEDYVPSPETTTASDCWKIIWSYNPSVENPIHEYLIDESPGFTAVIDPDESVDGDGSLRIETTKMTNVDDPNAFSWMENRELIYPVPGSYRVSAWIKTENVVESHISIIGRTSQSEDIHNNGTNQIASVPPIAINNTREGQISVSRYFNPLEWDPGIKILIVGINAGWSPDGEPSITWFDNIVLEHCPE